MLESSCQFYSDEPRKKTYYFGISRTRDAILSNLDIGSQATTLCWPGRALYKGRALKNLDKKRNNGRNCGQLVAHPKSNISYGIAFMIWCPPTNSAPNGK
ncbi:hypothetical protein Scep_023589 [Stephania cephalantha]|uniref:Uncharacterized protein n=1 Tax=Stephania cephalantha TaxID=152367 RepID=A0AAP0EVG6_9MAGN